MIYELELSQDGTVYWRKGVPVLCVGDLEEAIGLMEAKRMLRIEVVGRATEGYHEFMMFGPEREPFVRMYPSTRKFAIYAGAYAQLQADGFEARRTHGVKVLDA